MADILSWNAEFALAPDVIVLLELPVPRALERISRGRGRASLFEEHEYLEKVAEIYCRLDDPLMVRVDALGERESVHEAIVAALRHIETLQEYFPGDAHTTDLETE